MKFVYTVDKVESNLGVDFFHELDNDVEEEIEKNYKLIDWGL